MVVGNRGEAQITLSQAASCPRHTRSSSCLLVCKVTLRLMRHLECVEAKLQNVASFSVLYSQAAVTAFQ